MYDDFKTKLNNLLMKIEVNINEEDTKRFYDYMNLILEWNEKINLTAITEQNDIILKHFVDSLTIIKYIKDKDKILDVGTGAGFPGIPVSIINQTSEVTLLDSLNKRVIFLNDVIEKLNLKNIKAVHSRAEDLARTDKRETYDVVTSRAVANLSTLAEYMLPFAKKDGMCICMKGAEIEKELDDAKFAIEELGGKINLIDSFTLPESDIKRNVIIIKKITNTPKHYPRKSGQPLKIPLKNRK